MMQRFLDHLLHTGRTPAGEDGRTDREKPLALPAAGVCTTRPACSLRTRAKLSAQLVRQNSMSPCSTVRSRGQGLPAPLAAVLR